MRFEVPQFIEIEDKIVGPFTWRQFIYLGGGVGMAAVIFFATNIVVFVIVGLPIGLLAAALAFYPVNNRPFSFFLEAMFNYVTGQRLYLWRKKDAVVYRNKSTEPSAATSVASRPRGGESISAMARRLELQAMQKNTK